MLGGEAHYSDVYPLAEKLRADNGRSWPPSYAKTIHRYLQSHTDGLSGKGQTYFSHTSDGTYKLLPEYRTSTPQTIASITIPSSNNDDVDHLVDQIFEVPDDTPNELSSYQTGLEGIQIEVTYLKRTRDAALVKERRRIDNHTCQACGYLKEVTSGKFIIDVHHLNPIGKFTDITLTSIDDLICLCPNCHRIAHSRQNSPLSLEEIKVLLCS